MQVRIFIHLDGAAHYEAVRGALHEWVLYLKSYSMISTVTDVDVFSERVLPVLHRRARQFYCNHGTSNADNEIRSH